MQKQFSMVADFISDPLGWLNGWWHMAAKEIDNILGTNFDAIVTPLALMKTAMEKVGGGFESALKAVLGGDFAFALKSVLGSIASFLALLQPVLRAVADALHIKVPAATSGGYGATGQQSVNGAGGGGFR
jgi:hypothetical protein